MIKSCSVSSFNFGINNKFFSLMISFEFGPGITFGLLHQCSMSSSFLMKKAACLVFEFLHSPSFSQQ